MASLSQKSLAGSVSKAEKAGAWFCLHSQPKHEHIAAAHLRQMDGIEVFLPRVRFKRATRQGMAWVTEALFPGYLFVRFDWQNSLRQVQAATGVRGIVHFGEQWPVLSDQIIQELRQIVGDKELNTISPEFSPGDVVQIADGTLRGLHAVISQVTSSRARVAVLMDFLGRQTMIELSTNSVIKEGADRATILDKSVRSNS